MNTEKKKKPGLGPVMHILLFLVAVVLLLGQVSRSTGNKDIRRLQFYGEYSRDGVSWSTYNGQKLSALDGDLYLRGNFGMQFPEGSTLTFYAFHVGLSAELNGTPLIIGEDSRCSNRWISIDTPYISGDDQFTIRLTNSHILGNAHSYSHLLDGIYYGDSGAVRQSAERQAGVRKTVGIIVVALAVALMGMALVFSILGLSGQARLLPMGLMAMCYGGYLILTSPVVSFGAERPELLSAGLFLCIIVALMELSVLLRTCMTQLRKKIAGVILVLQIVWLVILMIGNLTGTISLCRLLDLWIPPQIIAMGILLALCAWEWFFVSNRNPGILASCGILIVAALAESLNEWLLLWGERMVLDGVVALFFFAYAVYGIVNVPLSIRKAAQAERLQSDLQQSRIVLAMSQIRAHFIFNILNAISGMCKYDPEKADATLIRFARYLRGNINVMQEDQPESFSVSLQHLQDYVALEQIRFGDRIRFQAETPVQDFNIPPLLMQPLVENAIKHGLTPKKEGGTITLRTRQQGDKILITVTDDGVGFSTDLPAKRESVGLSNVRFRLEQLVGGHMDITSIPGEGTTVTLTLPAERVRSIS